MKVCPACRTTFDDSQNFCLNDGTPLVAAETGAETDTIVSPPASNVEYKSYQTLPKTPAAPLPVGKKSNTGLIIAGTALATILLLAIGAGGWFLMSRGGNNNKQITQTNANTNAVSNSNSAPRPSPSAVNSNSAAANVNPTATNSTIIVSNANAETAGNTAPPSPPAHAISAKEAAAIRKEVTGTVNSWANAIESGNFNGHLNYYADTLDYYYNARGFSKNQVRSDKERAFQDFNNIQFNISNVRVTPERADRAIVVYDKEWLFENDQRATEGKVQSQLTLQKTGGRWLIVGERDLKVYYQESH